MRGRVPRGPACLVLAGLALACPEAPAPRGAGEARLLVSPREVDFGRVLQHRFVRREVTLLNGGAGELHLEGVETSCDCAVGEASARVLPPGGRSTLRVQLATRNEVGPVTRALVLVSNDPRRPRLEIPLRATVVAP
jgi:hypothetical protein